MLDRFIRKTQLTPPEPPVCWLRRGLLGDEPPVAVLEAGPGYGKTLALLEEVARAADAGLPTVWYSLAADDADVAIFFSHLVAGVQAHVPQFGETIRALLGSDRLEPALLWESFFDSLSAFNLPGFVLALDDVQHVAMRQPELVSALDAQLERLPAGTRVLLATRQRLPLGRSARMRGIDQAGLRFSPQETEAFLEMRAPEGRIPERWRKAAEAADGWPLGLDLASRLSTPEAHVPPWAYVAEELFLAQPAPRRELMLKAALLQDLTPEALRRVYDWPDAAAALEGLEADHLIQRLASGQGFRFPTYLQEFLEAELARAIAPDLRQSWHRRAADVFRLDGRHDLAIPHYLAAHAWEEARAACRPLLPGLRFNGRQAQLQRWLDAFPATVTAGDAWLQLWRAHALARRGESAQALAAYGRARALYAAAGDDSGVFKALVGQCNTALTLQDGPLFARLLEEALAHGGPQEDEDVADLWLIRAFEGERRGDMAQMRAFNEAVLGIAIGGNIEVAASHVIALMNLSTYALYRGDLARAARQIAQARETAEAWAFFPYRLSASFIEAHLQLLVGDLDRASAFLAALPPMWREQLDWHDRAIAHTVLGTFHQLRGDWPGAERELETAVALFDRAGFREGRKVPCERLMWLALQKRQFMRVERLWSEARDEGEGGLHDWALALPHARALHLAGRPEEALACLEKTIPALEGLGAQLHLARARLFEAASRLKLGDRRAGEAAARARVIMAEGQFDFLEGQDQVLWEELSALAAAPTTAERLVPAAPAADDGVMTCDLSLRLFGHFEVRQHGVLIDQWPRRKARLLLAALALHPEGLTAEALAVILGGEDVQPENLVRVNAWALRRALEPGLDKRAGSRYVRFEQDRYRLAPVATSDVAEFRRLIVEAEARREAAPAEAARTYERAIALVRGPLLDEGALFAPFEADRRRLTIDATEACLWLCAHHRRHGDYARAEAALGRGAALDPGNEEVYLASMRLYRALGQREKIRSVYWDCRKALKSREGRAPSEAFEAAYRALLTGAP